MARRRPLTAAIAFGLSAVLTACCPVATPPPTAFVATLEALDHGRALALLADGRQLTVTGLTSVPAGTVYVTGTLQPDGSVVATTVRPTGPTAPPPPQHR
jgi:hypothetical protein